VRAYQLGAFGLENLRLGNIDPPRPAPGQIVLDVKALSLNYRDLLVVRGQYNPRLRLPATPISDAAGVVSAVGDGVTRIRVGERVMTHYVAGWIDGPYHMSLLKTTLGTPGPGLAAEQVALPADSVLPIPHGYDFAQAATLPIAALTAWSALRSGGLPDASRPRPATVLTLGTGGVAIFALQLAKAMGAAVIITSRSAAKLVRARQLGADHVINTQITPDWDKAVLELTGGDGADLTVETAGGGTLNRSLAATRAGGRVSLLGVLSGNEAHINATQILMKQLRVQGILVGPRVEFDALSRFLEQHAVRPVIDRRFAFDGLPAALRCMEAGEHFGKIVIELQRPAPAADASRSADR
jgi:NADPH:quinone reductase-like Zn-dependent oxidoreductase